MLVRATEGLVGDASRLPWWQLPRDVVDVAGGHFGLIDESVSETARVIDEWLEALPTSGDAPGDYVGDLPGRGAGG